MSNHDLHHTASPHTHSMMVSEADTPSPPIPAHFESVASSSTQNTSSRDTMRIPNGSGIATKTLNDHRRSGRINVSLSNHSPRFGGNSNSGKRVSSSSPSLSVHAAAPRTTQQFKPHQQPQPLLDNTASGGTPTDHNGNGHGGSHSHRITVTQHTINSANINSAVGTASTPTHLDQDGNEDSRCLVMWWWDVMSCDVMWCALCCNGISTHSFIPSLSRYRYLFVLCCCHCCGRSVWSLENGECFSMKLNPVHTLCLTLCAADCLFVFLLFIQLL